MYFDEGVYVAYGRYEVRYEGLEFVLEFYGLWGVPGDILEQFFDLWCDGQVFIISRIIRPVTENKQHIKLVLVDVQN